MDSSNQWKQQDKSYHEDHEVVETFDQRIVHKYHVEHKYFTLERWIEVFKANKAQRVLDYGCATGNASLALSRRGIKAVAFDASLRMLEEVKKKAQALSLDVTCVQGDAEHLPFEDEYFDGSVCMGVLHHLPDIPRAIEEQIRVLNKGGTIFISEPFYHRAWISYPYHICIEGMRRVRDLFKRPLLTTPERLLTYGLLNEIKVVLKKHHLEYQIKYFVYWPNIIGFLPESIGYPLVCFFNKLNAGSNRGDIVFITITK